MVSLVLIINPNMTGKVCECRGAMCSSDKADDRNNMLHFLCPRICFLQMFCNLCLQYRALCIINQITASHTTNQCNHQLEVYLQFTLNFQHVFCVFLPQKITIGASTSNQAALAEVIFLALYGKKTTL